MYGPREVELTPAAPVALCALADVKTALGIVGSAQDALLTGLIASAAHTIETYCNTILGERTVTERVHSFEPCEACVLTYAPATELVSLAVKTVAMTLADYRLAKRYGTVRRVDYCVFEPGEHLFTYKAGYVSADVPQAVKTVALELVQWLYNTKAEGYEVAQESVPDAGAVTYASQADRTITRNGAALPARLALVLAPYVRVF